MTSTNQQTKVNMATQTVMSSIKATIAAATTLNQDWPSDAVFCVVSRTTTWPCGWDKTMYMQFFATQDELDIYIASQIEWARCEDNDFALRVYEWDWGPNERKQYERNGYKIPTQFDVNFDHVVVHSM